MWRNFEDFILSEISQTQKDKYCMFLPNTRYLKIVRFLEIESRMVVARRWEEGGCGVSA